MSKRIVYTKHDGDVAICVPAMSCIRTMSCGGWWNSYPRGFLKTQIERQIEAGHNADAVQRFVMAMQFGGCTEAEAYGIIRDRDCAHLGTGCELWDVDMVPMDRRYRDAWRRSHNGGPIYIDARLAQEIDERAAWAAYEARHGA
jgi:hypothetical protein